MGVTRLDVLIVLIILVWLYFSFAGPKYFEVKGQDIFGAIMTYETLEARGLGARADVTGIGFEDQRLIKVSGIILDASPEKIYLWDGDRTWVVFQKSRFLEIDERPQTPYIYPSSITLYPDESFRISRTDACSPDSFSTETLYMMLDKPASDILCSYLSNRLWSSYRGEISCNQAGNHLELSLALVRGFDHAYLNQVLSEFGYEAEKTWSLGRECLVIEYD